VKYVPQVLLVYHPEEGLPTYIWAREGYMYRIYPFIWTKGRTIWYPWDREG